MTIIIYNSSTGAIITSYSFCLPGTEQSAFISANTPGGCAALEVPDDSPALANPSKWMVTGGVLTSTG